MPDSLFSAVRCLECDTRMPGDLFPGICSHCGSPWLDAEYDYQRLPDGWTSLVASRPLNMWRYRELLPFSFDIPPVSMWEGYTPLLHAEALEKKYGDVIIHIKDERRQPTGSFKDRQASGTVSALKSRGITELVLASTGNAAAAYAAYCAKAGIKLWVFLANNVPSEKVRELALYGAEIIKIAGTYDQAKEIAADFAKRRNLVFDQGAKAIPGKEGFKTIAYEIAEQLGWRSPDWYLQAVSGGIGPLGVYKGFKELFALGIIDRIPKLGLIQVEGCAPMVRAYQQGLNKAAPVIPETLIAVLATGNPGLSYTMLKKSVDETGGVFLSVDDGETFRAMRKLARIEGFSMEPASSVAFAGLEKLWEAGQIKPGETVVVNSSGHTFSAEKHALEDRFSLHLAPAGIEGSATLEGLKTALDQLEEQVMTIVIIDDNPNDSRLIRRFLQHYKKYRIFDANNGPDGIDLVQQRKPDLVILDLTLPDMDGFSILSKLKENPDTKDIPVIVVSAKSVTEKEWRFLREQVDSVWEKGNFRPHELVGHVVKTMGDHVDNLPLVIVPSNGEHFGSNKRKGILIIDGNKNTTRSIYRLLKSRQRFEVFEVLPKENAIRKMQITDPDLILVDEESLGHESTSRLWVELKKRKKIPEVILLRSEANSQASVSPHDGVGIDSVWIKENLDQSKLMSRIESLLE